MRNAEQMPAREVDVLRQRFRLSGNLSNAVRPLLETTSRKATLKVYSSKEITLDPSTPLQSVLAFNDQFLRLAQPFYLEGKIELAEDKILIYPRAQRTFNELARMTDALPDMKPQPKDMDHFLYVELPEAALLKSLDERRRAVEDYKKAVVDVRMGRLHSVVPVGLEVGSDRGPVEVRELSVPTTSALRKAS